MMNFRVCLFGICWLLFALNSAPAVADELSFDAAKLFDASVTEHLHLNTDVIELQRGVLYEDDGPAAGYSYQPNEEKLTGNVWIKKELLIPAPSAAQATLLVGPGGELNARINGKSVELELIGKEGNYWQAYRFAASALKPGKNEIVLTGTGKVWIARDDDFASGSATGQQHPNRSAKSSDGGKTWTDQKLGIDGNIDGEYYVRVFLDQHQQAGQLTTPVVDAGNLAGAAIGPPMTDTGPVRIAVEMATKNSNRITLFARSGTTFVPNEDTWTPWQELALTDAQIAKPRGRFVQFRLRLSTDDPLATPQLRSLRINASPTRPADWTKHIRVEKFDNPTIVRSSIPFAYEPFDQKELAELRQKFNLDEVVAGAKSEFELIQRLAAWSATRWKKMHLKDSYPPYNALEILKPHDDGTPVGGFCQQYNVVFLQACESFGLVGRLVSIGPGPQRDAIRGGHETVEIWSNEWGKWIYIDGNTAWYAVDRQSRVPLSLWELRQRQLAAFAEERYEPIEVIVLTETKHKWPDLQSWPPLVELRLIPRSDFLHRPAPLPLNQGMRGWFWTGHYAWTDEQAPAKLLYGNRIAKRGNFEWTLNQAHLVFEASEEPGTLRVHIDTHTPGFKHFVVTHNDSQKTQLESEFLIKLQLGKNTLKVVPQNQAGRTGIAGSLELYYLPDDS